MNEKNEDPFGMATIVTAWTKAMGNLWAQSSTPWGAPQGQQQADAKAGTGAGANAQAATAAALKNWQTMVAAMAAPESMSALLKGSGTMPEVLLKLAQTSMGSMMELHEKMIQRLARIGDSVEAYQFENIDENMFRVWTDIYEKEFQQFFQIPQLGLMRTYQEKSNQVADKYNLLQSTLSEFTRLLALPFNRSMLVMQEKLGEMANNGQLTEDTKVYYNMWVKVLEGHFMTLFQTPEYVETLSRTINALADFSDARNAALEDLLGMLPVAKRSEMDDMARELYQLKKRLRKLEKSKK
jgi:class III poly(R)-hydroxyalkanoic acid synthase PhaE subunit